VVLATSLPALKEIGTRARVAQVAGYIIRQYADYEKNGISRVQLHFDRKT
jgi:hypothetical protein